MPTISGPIAEGLGTSTGSIGGGGPQERGNMFVDGIYIPAILSTFSKIIHRDQDGADSIASGRSGYTPEHPRSPFRPITPVDDGTSEAHSNESSQRRSETQQAVDMLFDRYHLKNEWMAPTPPNVLGELLDSTHMLPLALPSDPEYLAAWPGPSVEYIIEQEEKERKRQSRDLTSGINENPRNVSRASVGHRGEMQWRMRSRAVREVLPSLVDWVDGGVRARKVHDEADDREEDGFFNGSEFLPTHFANGNSHLSGQAGIKPWQEDSFTAPTVTLRRHGSNRAPRESSGADTIVPSDFGRLGSLTPERAHRLY